MSAFALNDKNVFLQKFLVILTFHILYIYEVSTMYMNYLHLPYIMYVQGNHHVNELSSSVTLDTVHQDPTETEIIHFSFHHVHSFLH